MEEVNKEEVVVMEEVSEDEVFQAIEEGFEKVSEEASEKAAEEAAEEDPDPAGRPSRSWPEWPGTFAIDATAGSGSSSVDLEEGFEEAS